MSSAVGVKISGAKQIVDRLKLLSDDIATKVGQAANRAAAVFVMKKAIDGAPISGVSEGAVRKRHNTKGGTRTEKHHKIINAMKVVKARTYGVNAVSNTIKVDKKAYQASFVEWGSVHNAPNAFLRRAVENNSDEAIQKIAEVINKRLTKMGV